MMLHIISFIYVKLDGIIYCNAHLSTHVSTLALYNRFAEWYHEGVAESDFTTL